MKNRSRFLRVPEWHVSGRKDLLQRVARWCEPALVRGNTYGDRVRNLKRGIGTAPRGRAGIEAGGVVGRVGLEPCHLLIESQHILDLNLLFLIKFSSFLVFQSHGFPAW